MIVTRTQEIPESFFGRHSQQLTELRKYPYWAWVESICSEPIDDNIFLGNVDEGMERTAIWAAFLELHPFLGPAKRAIDETTKD